MDLDREKFFDRVNHDLLMARLARRIADKRLLRIIRRLLKAGLMRDGVCVARHEGTSQGGALSKLLANPLLDDLDKKTGTTRALLLPLRRRSHPYVHSKAAVERVLASLIRFLGGELRLSVNREIIAVAFTEDRKFLGCGLLSGGRPGIAPKSLERAKDRARQITRRHCRASVERMPSDLNSFLTGWVSYFRHVACKSHLTGLDGWVRRKPRCVWLKHCKRTKTLADFFQSHGVSVRNALLTASSGKGWWRLAGSPAVNQAMDQRWFDTLGLVNLAQRYATLNG